MSKLQTSYPFAIAIATASALTACQTHPEGPTASATPLAPSSSVMDAKKVRIIRLSRASMSYTQEHWMGRTFLIQNTRWSDNSESRTLAGVWLGSETPVEMIVTDNFTPQAPAIDNNPAPLKWDLVPNVRTFSYRTNGDALVDAVKVLSSKKELEALPQCLPGEVRAIARVIKPEESTRTIPSTRESLAEKRLAENVLSTAQLVCLSFQNDTKSP